MIIRRMQAVVLASLAVAGWVAQCGAADEAVRQGRASVDGLEIFYREAGDPVRPTIVLLHGFPSSSHMFRDLIPALALNFRVIAPDYPGMGSSAVPPEGSPPLTFDKVADYVEKFLDDMHVNRTILYMQDFGGPIGMRLATRNPERVAGLVIQNTPISLDGWEPGRLKAVQGLKGPVTPERRAAVEARVALATDVFLYKKGAAEPDRLSPDAVASDAFALADPARRRAMVDLQLDIPSNLDLYPAWQSYLRTAQPKALVVWGDGDPIFIPRGADAIEQYDSNVVVRHYAAGHFALEERHDEIAREILKRFGG
ncbi:alpha/beta fold hydrolase [Rhizobium deserti]|uniref:Alpha/beta fold hydrolase n=2 Tax=Rhizobium deserti TaxID=2547961 RepID=A0A4R5UPA9_9HYPH|nr:alpha/beta fold hydrolase [Rhizobium deserti]